MKLFASLRFWLILAAVFFAFIYALPNLYGYKPAINISGLTSYSSPQSKKVSIEQVKSLFATNNLSYDSIKENKLDGSVLAEFNDVDSQLLAKNTIDKSNEFFTTLKLQPQHPNWLNNINALPMYLGLDLRGGVYFLMEVDANSLIKDLLSRYFGDFEKKLQSENLAINLTLDDSNQQIIVESTPENSNKIVNWLQDQYAELSSDIIANQDKNSIITIKISEQKIKEIIDFSIKQNMITLRNRIDELGVAEPIVQRQGSSHIVIQLPGIQDTKRAKEILGATASLEFRPVNQDLSVNLATQRGRAPKGNELLYMRLTNAPILLKNEIIVSGNQVIDAASSISQQTNEPIVSITLDSAGGEKMLEFTQKSLGKRMGVVYIEYLKDQDGKLVSKKSVISDAVIQGVFSSRFQVSGLESQETAHNLALLLRSGALAAPMDIVEERTMGPSLGKQNIMQGVFSLISGLALVLGFMIYRYKKFGLIADVCLLLNLIFICAILSLFQATLTLPGIAGIVLTMGMAVDANVLIFERIREQLKAGYSNYESITQGFAQAFQTIFDANITTLIAAVVLFVFGTGPIKGFALTLSIGVLSSMFTAIYVGRFLVDLLYQKTANSKTSKSLSI